MIPRVRCNLVPRAHAKGPKMAVQETTKVFIQFISADEHSFHTLDWDIDRQQGSVKSSVPFEILTT